MNTTKNDLLNEYSKLRAIDWFNAGDVNIKGMEKSFDRIKSSAKRFNKAELYKMVKEVKARHKANGIIVL